MTVTVSSSADAIGERDALPDSEQRHRLLFESSSAVQLIIDEATGALLDANPSAEAFYGWPRATMRSMQISDIEDTPLDHWREMVLRLNAQRTDVRVHHHRVSHGERRDVEVVASATVFDRRPVLHLFVHDVTDRVNTASLLRDRDAQFRAVINAMSEGVMVHDASGAIRAHNPSAEQILGLGADALRGLTPTQHEWHAIREDGTPWPAKDHPVMLALQSAHNQPRVLMGVRRSDGEDVWLQMTANPLVRADEHAPYAAVAVFTDVTSTRHAEERLRQAQKLEVVGQLAAGIAHDFNNLLTVMRGAADLLAHSLSDNATTADDVAVILRATERAEELTRQLLAFGRRQMLRTAAVDLRALVLQQLPSIRDASPQHIDVRTELGDRRIVASMDLALGIDALHALVDNARAAMPDGGTLTVTTDVQSRVRLTSLTQGAKEPPFAMLAVRDTGVGMSDAVRARVFEPFFSTRPFGANHGMGLASVHGMMAQSQGFVEIDSALGVGTTVRLFFPCETGEERVITPRESLPPIPSRGILLVDDDELLRTLTARMLERLGHTVTVAESGERALALLASHRSLVSLMLTDLTMPGIGGMELIARAQAGHQDLPIVAISGFTLDPSVREELSRRRVTFVSKPFQLTELSDAIDRARATGSAAATDG